MQVRLGEREVNKAVAEQGQLGMALWGLEQG